MKIKIFLLLFHIVVFTSNISVSNENSILNITDDDFVIGDNDAPITIIEYASMSCSHCASFHNNTLETLKKEYIDTGKVKFVFRDFPYNYPALLGTMVVRCLPDDIRYDLMNALYRLQKQWVQKENAESTKELFKIMQSGGMNKEEFEACIYNVELENKIIEELMAVQKEFKIKSTPSFIINGNLLQGNKSIKDFRQIIDKILSE